MKKIISFGLFLTAVMALSFGGYALAAKPAFTGKVTAKPVTNKTLQTEKLFAKSKGVCTPREWTELCPGSETRYRSCEITTKCDIVCRGVCPNTAQTR